MLIVLVTLGIFILTKNPATSFLKLHFALLSIIILFVYVLALRKSKEQATEDKTFFYIVIVSVLSVVGATGWFFSPFFFTLYLVAIVLSFMFTPSVSLAFIVTLVFIFSFNIGEVDLTYDFLVVLSLLTTIPLSLYLRREYLRLKEAQKEILILQHQKEAFKTKIEEVLANSVINFGATIRQPINDTKQIGYRLGDIKDKSQREKYQKRLLASSEEALRILKNFEEDVTGKRLLTTITKKIAALPTPDPE